MTPASATISAGGSQSYSAEGRDQYDNSLGDITDDATFTIGPNGSCTGNTCTPSTAGAHAVTATRFAKTGTASLQVTSGNLDHIVLSPGAATIGVGESQTYSVEGFDGNGNSLGDFTLATTLTISPDGSCTGNTCTATTVGDHTVTAINNGETSSAVLTVTAGALDHLVVSPSSATIVPGGSQIYTAYGRDQYDNWLGDETAITTFTIAPDGSCTGNTCTASVNGAHTVTATIDQITGSGTLQVTPAAAIDHIVVSPAPATIAAGDSQTYTAEAFDSSNNSLGDVTGSTSFTIGPDARSTPVPRRRRRAHRDRHRRGEDFDTASLSVTAGPPTTWCWHRRRRWSPPAPPRHIPRRPRPVQQLAGRRHRQHHLHDRARRLLHPCHLYSAARRRAYGDGDVARRNWHSDADRVVGGGRSHRDQPGLSARSRPASRRPIPRRYRRRTIAGDVTGSTTFTIAPDGSCTGNTCTRDDGRPHTVTGLERRNTSNAA